MISKWDAYSQEFEFFVIILSITKDMVEEEWLREKVEKLIDHMELDYANLSYYKIIEGISKETNRIHEKNKVKFEDLERNLYKMQDIVDSKVEDFNKDINIIDSKVEDFNKDIDIAKDGLGNLSDQIRSQRFDTIGLMTLVFTLFTLVGSNATVIGKVSTVDFCHFSKILLAVNVTIALSGVIIFLVSKWCITGKFCNKNW